MEGVTSEALERAWMFPGRSERGCGPKNWFAGLFFCFDCLIMSFLKYFFVEINSYFLLAFDFAFFLWEF